MYPSFETERLLLTPRAERDNKDLQILFNDWAIIQNLVDLVPWPYPEDGVEDYWRTTLGPDIESGKELCWALRLKSDPDKAIGQINLRPDAESDQRGFWLGRPYWGQGLMSEAVDTVTDHWFRALAKPNLVITTRVDNTGSNRIKEKQGFRLIGQKAKRYAGGFEHDTLIWQLDSTDYFTRQKHKP